MSEQEVKELDLNGEMLVRREKLAALRAKGNAFPNRFRRDSLAKALHDQYEAEDGEALKEKHIEEMKHLEKRAETLFDYLNLKYRLSEREIEVLVLYYGLDGHKKKTFSQISEITKIDEDSLDKILKGAMFKLSNVDEKVEL